MAWELPPELTVSGEHKTGQWPPTCPVCGSSRYSKLNFLSHKVLRHEPGCSNDSYQPRPPLWKVYKFGQWLKDYIGIF